MVIHRVIQPTIVWSFSLYVGLYVWKKTQERKKVILRDGRSEVMEKPKYIGAKTEQ